MPTLTITRGLPGSGKTTRARAWVAESPATRVRVNRDDTRAMMHGARLGTPEQERQVTVARDATVTTLLRKGINVICDDTTLPQRFARDLRKLATAAGAGFAVWDLTDVPLDECLRRNDNRAGTPAFVPPDVIREMWTKYVQPLKGRPLPPPENDAVASEPQLYVPDPGLPRAWLVDLDGTLAAMSDRSPYDWARVGEDTLGEPVAEIVSAIIGAGTAVVVMSGRDAVCRPQTEEWLNRHGIKHTELHMRPAGDQRKDSIVKGELFWAEVAPRWQVIGTIDDRNQVVQMWRDLGLTCLQAAPGDF